MTWRESKHLNEALLDHIANKVHPGIDAEFSDNYLLRAKYHSTIKDAYW